MNGSSSRALASCLLLLMALGGCGKTLTRSTGSSSASRAVEPVSTQGASGLSTENTSRLGGSSPVIDAAAVARAVHPGLTTATRPQAVVLVNERDWPAALAASVLSSAPLRAPLLYSEGNSLPMESSQALHAMRPSGASLLGGLEVIELMTSAAPLGYRARMLTSREPAELAAELEPLVATIHGGPPRQVIIASSDGPPSLSMPAASLAAQTGAPILFVETSAVPVATSVLLAHLKQPTMYVIGPTSSVSQSVSSELERYGPVKRINGDSPASNAIAVAQFSDGSFGWGIVEPGHGLVFANAARPLDAPAAASLSASGDYGPLLLLESPYAVPGELASYLNDIQPGYTDEPQCRPVRGVYNHGWLIGDEHAITPTVQAELDTMLEISSRKACTAPPITP